MSKHRILGGYKLLPNAVASCYKLLQSLPWGFALLFRFYIDLYSNFDYNVIKFSKNGVKMETYTRKQVAEMLKVTQAYLASKKMRDVLPFYKDPTNGFITYEKKIVDDYIEAKIEAVKARYFS